MWLCSFHNQEIVYFQIFFMRFWLWFSCLAQGVKPPWYLSVPTWVTPLCGGTYTTVLAWRVLTSSCSHNETYLEHFLMSHTGVSASWADYALQDTTSHISCCYAQFCFTLLKVVPRREYIVTKDGFLLLLPFPLNPLQERKTQCHDSLRPIMSYKQIMRSLQ